MKTADSIDVARVELLLARTIEGDPVLDARLQARLAAPQKVQMDKGEQTRTLEMTVRVLEPRLLKPKPGQQPILSPSFLDQEAART
jgi:hypothetical protein